MVGKKRLIFLKNIVDSFAIVRQVVFETMGGLGWLSLLLTFVFGASGVHAALSDASNVRLFLRRGHAVLQLGGYWSQQGQVQHIAIQDLIGDQFTVTHPDDNNGLVGFGYILEGKETPLFRMSYGVNAFYLAKTSVVGNVVQEDAFTNLAYRYNLTHYPVYVVAKSTMNAIAPEYALTMEVGIGPNFIKAGGFQERSLDGITIPDTIFSSHTTTAFSATAGFGVKLNHVFGSAPLECGYRFFYLGEGQFNKANNQALTTLKTGRNYANAMVCSVAI